MRTNERAETDTRWLIDDGGGWSTEARLYGEVSFEVAKTILLSIRHGTLIDQREIHFGDYPEPTALDNRIPSIKYLENGSYTVGLSDGVTGTILQVKIVEGRVELHGISWWIA